MSETTLEIEDGVAVFTLNRPEKMNAISQDMFLTDLPEMVARAREDDDNDSEEDNAGNAGNECVAIITLEHAP